MYLSKVQLTNYINIEQFGHNVFVQRKYSEKGSVSNLIERKS